MPSRSAILQVSNIHKAHHLEFTMKSFAHLLLAAVVLSLAPLAATAAEATGFIHLEEIDGRSWLVNSKGRLPSCPRHHPHRHGEDRHPYEKIAEACKDAGFNAYGYGCPDATQGRYALHREREPRRPHFPVPRRRQLQLRRHLDLKVQRKSTVRSATSATRTRTTRTSRLLWPIWRLAPEHNRGANWVDFTRKLPAAAPGRRAYDSFLETWKGDGPAARDQAFVGFAPKEIRWNRTK